MNSCKFHNAIPFINEEKWCSITVLVAICPQCKVENIPSVVAMSREALVREWNKINEEKKCVS